MYAEKYPQGATANVNYLSEASCSPTIITPKFGETTVFEGDKALEKKWVDKIKESAQLANKQISSKEFAMKCQSLNVTKTNGKTVQEVCREIVCSSAVHPTIGFYNNPGTKAIAYESEGGLFVNIAKDAQGAGGTGNLVHEFTHTLGYKHFTNFALLGQCSVPYRVGNLVEELVNNNN
jgi:hypothetical protein